MKVSEILSKKGALVETVDGNASFAAVARLMIERKIGSVVISDTNGAVLGIVSERDITQAVSVYGPDAFALKARTLMQATIITCKPDDNLRDVMAVMTKKRARHVVVMLDKTLAGIISVGDAVKCRLEETELEVNVLRDHARFR